MKILLFGKDGQIGWQLQRSLAPHGELTMIGRADCDLGSPDAIRAVLRQIQPDIVVNGAGVGSPFSPRDEEGSSSGRAINVDAVAAMAEACSIRNTLFVHFSSCQVFDGARGQYAETDMPAPQGGFGLEKFQAEQAIQAVRGQSIVFRCGPVFGARGESLIKKVLRQAERDHCVHLARDPLISPTPAALVATVTGLVLAMRRQSLAPDTVSTGCVYHLAACQPVRLSEFAGAIIDCARQTAGFEERLGCSEIPVVVHSPQCDENFSLSTALLERQFGLVMPAWDPYLRRMLQLLALKRNGY